LSLEKSFSEDVAIMVDVLRASTTITVALDNFKEIIPVKNLKDAKILAEKYGAILAGERNGETINGFDVGNSPVEIKKHEGNILILTTSNGTRILEGIKSKALIGSFINSKSVSEMAYRIANSHIEIVMAGVGGRFVIEDFLGAGKIIAHLKNYDDCKLDELALAAYIASIDDEIVNDAVIKSNSSAGLAELGYFHDVKFCLKRNIYDTVPVYVNGKISKMTL